MDRIPTNWIGLRIKYKGKCFVCSKEISVGEYALWSRTNKSIRHPECNQNEKIESFTVDSKKNLQCYICRKSISNNDYTKDLEFDVNSDTTFICNKCINTDNVYLEYQKKFLDSLNKTKIKFTK